MDRPEFWKIVRRLATRRLGVTVDSIYVWKCRNSVPYRYRLPLVAMSAGAVSAMDFARLDLENKRQRLRTLASRIQKEPILDDLA